MTACGHSKVPNGWYCQREIGHPGPCAAVDPHSKIMTASEFNEVPFFALVAKWLGKACHNPDGEQEDCGDHDCKTFRECAKELEHLVRGLRIYEH
jgi:hypothetical protein